MADHQPTDDEINYFGPRRGTKSPKSVPVPFPQSTMFDVTLTAPSTSGIEKVVYLKKEFKEAEAHIEEMVAIYEEAGPGARLWHRGSETLRSLMLRHQLR